MKRGSSGCFLAAMASMSFWPRCRRTVELQQVVLVSL